MNRFDSDDLGSRVATSLLARGEEVPRRLVASYRQNPGYRGLSDETVADDLIGVAAANERLLLRRLQGLAYTHDDAVALAEGAVRRFAQGIPESEVTRAYRLWSMAIWTEISETAQALDAKDPRELSALASVVLEHNEYATGLASDAYEAERGGIWIRGHRGREVDIAQLTGPDVTRASLADLEGSLGQAGKSAPHLTMLLLTARDTAGARNVHANAVVREAVDAWQSTVAEGSLVAVDARTVLLIGRLISLDGWQRYLTDEKLSVIAMATASSKGLPDLVATYAELREVLEVAKLLSPAAEPFTWKDTLVASMTRTAPAPVRQRLLDTYVTLRKVDERTAAPLILTLRAFLDQNLNVKATADALYSHPNTIRYRLTRIQTVVGLDVFDGADRLVLRLALALRDLYHPA